jgi:hypothetical protein
MPPGFRGSRVCSQYPFARRRLLRMRHLTAETSAIPDSRDVLTSEGSWKKFLTHARQSLPMAPTSLFVLAAHRQPLCWNFLYHSRIVLSVGGSVWYLVRNLRCTVTIDSVLPNSKTQNTFVSLALAMFLHYCALATKPASTPWHLLSKPLGEIL